MLSWGDRLHVLCFSFESGSLRRLAVHIYFGWHTIAAGKETLGGGICTLDECFLMCDVIDAILITRVAPVSFEIIREVTRMLNLCTRTYKCDTSVLQLREGRERQSVSF